MERIKINYLDGSSETLIDISAEDITITDTMLVITGLDALENKVFKAFNLGGIKNYEIVSIDTPKGEFH